ncbi:MAG: hypothetical protein ACREOQ_23240 [Gemmatimonadales bacterium]
MASSVRTFSRAHPSTDASYALVLDRLDGTIVRLEELAKQQAGGIATKHSSEERRKDLRRQLHYGLIRQLANAAEDAADEVPGIAEKFQRPSTSATHTAFRAVASKLLEEGRANQEVLAKHGYSGAMMDQLEAGVKEFDGSLQESDDSKQAHVAARAEMKDLGDEIMRIVAILDGFNRYRFHRSPELIVAWESAKHLVGGAQGKEKGPEVPGTNPVPSGLEPAA